MPSARVELWPDRVLAIARLGRVAMHAHTASALLVGIDGRFGLRLGERGAAWQAVEHVVIAAGCMHELDCGETSMGVLYLAPGLVDHRQLCARAELAADARVHVLGSPRERRAELAAIFAGELEAGELDAWVARQVGGPPPERHAIDPRVEQVVALISEQPDRTWSLADLAARAGVSASRLQHLFRAEVGTTPRQLRTWQRLRAVTRHFAAGSNLTSAAHAAGFVDSAHMSKAFRQLFGLPPSRVLASDTRLRVHGPAGGPGDTLVGA